MRILITQEEIMQLAADKVLEMTGTVVNWENFIFDIESEDGKPVVYNSVEIYIEDF